MVQDIEVAFRGIETGSLEALLKLASSEYKSRPYSSGLEDSAVGGETQTSKHAEEDIPLSAASHSLDVCCHLQSRLLSVKGALCNVHKLPGHMFVLHVLISWQARNNQHCIKILCMKNCVEHTARQDKIYAGIRRLPDLAL